MIQGDLRENGKSQDFKKKVGLFEGEVIAVNPTAEEYKEILNIDLPETSKVTDYLKQEDGIAKLRIDVWLKEVKSGDNMKVSFFLEDREREDKDKIKKLYINNVGKCMWASDPNNLSDYFKKWDYRVAFVGEEYLYKFFRVWLGKLNFSKEESSLKADWKKLMKGNVSELRNQINGAYSTTVGSLAIITTKERDGEIKEYQGVFGKSFFPVSSFAYFHAVDYNSSTVQQSLRNKRLSEIKPHELFVNDVIYGCKDYYTFRDIAEYNPDANIVASDAVISDDGSDF